ncbi:MAG TPA: 4-alpha-glucanotransferase, partial [Pirellulales bacterium]
QAIEARLTQLQQEVLPPVAVLWDGREGGVAIRLPEAHAHGNASFTLTLESGETSTESVDLDALPHRRVRRVGEVNYVNLMWRPQPLPMGYHTLSAELNGETWTTTILSAPTECYQPAPPKEGKLWGVFTPLYSLHREGRWGSGDYTDLKHLLKWVADQGGSLVATLPLAASFVQATDDPSPYSPASRLFANELFVDVEAAPEVEYCATAKTLFKSKAFQAALAELRVGREVDYAKYAALKTRVFKLLAKTFFTDPRVPAARRAAYENFVKSQPGLQEYARFRAAGETLTLNWRVWPKPMCDGRIPPHRVPDANVNVHLYAQFLAYEQQQELVKLGRERGMLSYLDLPLGVSSDGYDVWKYRDCFALGASGGAPPDSFFTKGQDWGFPPLHPENLRATRYEYFIQVMRTQLAYAKVLRIDHCMGLHRLYWVPHGAGAKEGVYVRYPFEDLYAIVTLESQRQQSTVVGENLGTVPDAVERELARHKIGGLYVLQYEAGATKTPAARAPFPLEAAGVNTHDMPQFSAYWQALDVADRLDLDLVNAEEAEELRADREQLRQALIAFLTEQKLLKNSKPTESEVLEAVLVFLGRSDAAFTLINLEDLWSETRPQNTPGTWKERPNWRVKHQHTFEKWKELEPVQRIVAAMRAARRA